MVTSEITNALDFIPQSTEITLVLAPCSLGQTVKFSAIIRKKSVFNSSYTWEFLLDEEVPFGAVELLIESSVETNINQNTEVRMSYNGFTCYATLSNDCNQEP